MRPKDVLRFIPAYAGNSQDTHLVRDLPSVHPRLRGELTIRISMVICTSGSSPLTRGTLNDSPYKALTRTVHPRLRGELLNGAPLSQDQGGSSPLTRGTQKTAAEGCRNKRFIPAYAGNSTLTEYLSKWPASRFIPAYAGNSLPVNPTSTEGPVHPRLRGELMVYGLRYRSGCRGVHPRLRGELEK